ncbi:MAG: F0F1 ATP synthase subunit B [Fimbriimonadaceae bacterium]|nr:F0F1 ATP synthase subunit B [Fimbriimonadaceae bacterium]
MSAQTQESKGMPYPVMAVIGALLMFGGMYLSTDPPSALSFQADLAAQGIPLDLGKTIATIGVFLILFPAINLFFLKPLEEAISERTNTLEEAFTDAESLREEMRTMRSDYERKLIESEENARTQIQSQIKEAQDLRTQMVAEANAKVDEMTRRAREDMESERAKVMGDLRLHVANLAFQATEKILSENVDDARNRKLVDDFITQAEVGTK